MSLEGAKSGDAPAGADGVRRLLAARLDFAPLERFGAPRTDAATGLRDAAVLIPIVERRDGPQVLLTLRPETMTSHPGQISFPGGRIDPGDAGPVAAALREAEEEVGLPEALVEVRGVLDPLETGTGFRIVPAVGLVDDAFEAIINETEVAEAFEVPFEFLMDPANHALRWGEFRGQRRSYYEMVYDGRRVWGATARIIVDLHNRLFEAP
jgi:8-oxo-dGTP pyrophosphatase MutT (NUDIX family)